MSKAVLFSIRPKYCELIASGKKTVEVRKTRPKIDVPFKCYIYCTINGTTAKERDKNIFTDLRGKVIGEFVCDSIISHCEMANADIAEQQGCIKRETLLEYSNGKELYGFHISDLVIYDKPRELGEFSSGSSRLEFSNTEDGFPLKWSGMKRPPQSWMYCYMREVV